MIKRVIKFLDKHRIILVLLILLVTSILFLGIKSIIFLNHDFKALKCTKEIDDIYCYYNDIKIFKDAEKTKDNFFSENRDAIDKLRNDFELPEFNKYTAYYYEVITSINYTYDIEYEKLYNFFEIYNNTYDIENFYLKNNLYYEIFYSYKLL